VPHYDDSKLDAEIIRLLEQQIELMELAAFVRLTDAELSEYQRREKRISELLEHAEMFKDAA
jgi:hypothetical protein